MGEALTGHHRRQAAAVFLLFLVAGVCTAANRHWQTGTWRESETKRKMLDFGPGSTSFDGRPSSPSMRAMADIRTFVIETDDLRLELEDVVPVSRRSVDVTLGTPVTFALEKNTVYVRDADGKEHKLRVTKKVVRTIGGPTSPSGTAP